jgi:AcrR family transcriptional regulator
MNKTKNKPIKERISNRQRSRKTSAQLIVIAKELFSTRGYSDTSQEEIVRQAGMTRGALYHHFDGKKGLFLAVFENALTEIASRVIQAEKKNCTAWDNFISCTYEFFAACLNSDLQRIVLIDAPAVLGWDVWRQVDQSKTLDILKSHLKELLDSEIIRPIPLEPLTHFISGAVNESVLWISGSDDPKKAFDESWPAVESILSSLKK